jgi:hypothetical protein
LLLAACSSELRGDVPLSLVLALELLLFMSLLEPLFGDVEAELETCVLFTEPVIWTCCPTKDASDDVSPLSFQWLPESSTSANDWSVLFWLRQPSIVRGWSLLLVLMLLCVLTVLLLFVSGALVCAGGAELSGGMVCAGCSGRVD